MSKEEIHQNSKNGAEDRLIALLVDADNMSHAVIPAIIAELSKYGTANIRRAYGDWGSDYLSGWRSKLLEFAIRPMQQFSYTSGKNATDIALVIDAMELLYTQRIDGYCIVSSDGDFTPLIMHLKAAGKRVYGFGKASTPPPFVNACTTFLYVENLESADDVRAKVEPGRVENQQVKTAKDLACDTKLVTALRGAVEACKGDDGWSHLGAAGGAVRRQAPIDPRNYGRKNFRALFDDIGLFVIDRAPNEQPYIADKRNKDRTAKPTAV